MRKRFTSHSLIETVVTLGAAAMMTIAGSAMVEDMIVAHAGGTMVGAIVAAPRDDGSRG